MFTNIVTRFAPSPTGPLHLGHGWSALRAHDFARAHGGRFVLRLEDIDQTRCRADYVDAILADLDWLGLHPDAILVQSQHGDRYRAALETLIAAGLAYRCWCTRREIATAGGAPQGEAGPVYPRFCRHRADPGDGRPFCWRLDSEAAAARFGRLVWHDALAGPVIADPHALGDVVIARKDAETSYHLAVSLDDAAQGVTHVFRGIDLFASTHVHRLVQAALDLPVPHYHHHALVRGPDGERLAKRRDAPTLAALRADGVDAQALVADLRADRFPLGFALMPS